MPGFNRTGPFSEGPLTGRGRGRCGGGATATERPEVGAMAGSGRGRRRRGTGGCGGGMGRRWARQSAAEADAGNESDWLRGQAERLSAALEDIEAELGELESGVKK